MYKYLGEVKIPVGFFEIYTDFNFNAEGEGGQIEPQNPKIYIKFASNYGECDTLYRRKIAEIKYDTKKSKIVSTIYSGEDENAPEVIEHNFPYVRFTVEETSDAFSDPYIIRDNLYSDESEDRYFTVMGIRQTFENKQEALRYANGLNALLLR